MRAPDNRGVFNPDMMNDLGHQLRKNLLVKAEEYRKEQREEERKNMAQSSEMRKAPHQQKQVKSQLSVDI